MSKMICLRLALFSSFQQRLLTAAAAWLPAVPPESGRDERRNFVSIPSNLSLYSDAASLVSSFVAVIIIILIVSLSSSLPRPDSERVFVLSGSGAVAFCGLIWNHDF